MKSKWPTLEGRLNQPLTSEREALEQLQTMIPLSKHGLKRLLKCIKEDKKLQAAAKKVKIAVDVSPNTVTFEEAKKQVENFRKPV